MYLREDIAKIKCNLKGIWLFELNRALPVYTGINYSKRSELKQNWRNNPVWHRLTRSNLKDFTRIDRQFDQSKRSKQTVPNCELYRNGTGLCSNLADGSQIRDQNHTPPSKAMLVVVADHRSRSPITRSVIARISVKRSTKEMKRSSSVIFDARTQILAWWSESQGNPMAPASQ
jgi:hypothetical protein